MLNKCCPVLFKQSISKSLLLVTHLIPSYLAFKSEIVSLQYFDSTRDDMIEHSWQCMFYKQLESRFSSLDDSLSDSSSTLLKFMASISALYSGSLTWHALQSKNYHQSNYSHFFIYAIAAAIIQKRTC